MKNYRKPYRVKKKRSLLKSRYFWRGILFLLLAGEVFYIIYFFPFFQIKEVKISGNEQITLAEVKKFIPVGRSLFLFNGAKAESEILENYPYIESLKIKKKLPDKVAMQIIERKPSAVWCLEDSPCFNADKNGVIFEKIGTLPFDYIIIKDFQTEKEPVLGEKVIESLFLSSIKDIAQKASDFGITPDIFKILAGDRLNLKIADSGEIYFNPQNDLNWQLTKLKAVLENEISKESRKNLEYIDLRFGNLAPYKYR